MFFRRGFATIQQVGEAAVIRNKIKHKDLKLYKNLCGVVHSNDFAYDLSYCKCAQKHIDKGKQLLKRKKNRTKWF